MGHLASCRWGQEDRVEQSAKRMGTLSPKNIALLPGLGPWRPIGHPVGGCLRGASVPISLSVTVPLPQPSSQVRTSLPSLRSPPPPEWQVGFLHRSLSLRSPLDGIHPRKAPFAIPRCFAFSFTSLLELSWAVHFPSSAMQISGKFH